MTRSSLSKYSPEVTKKAFRAKAKEAGLTFRAAAEKRTTTLAQQKIYSPSRTTRRQPESRVDGTYWDSTTFTCARKTHGAIVGEYVGDDCASCADDICPVCEQEWEVRGTRGGDGNSPRAVVLDSLLDIAKPAKPKGVAKEFEVIAQPLRVIALHDDSEYTNIGDYWEEDWTSEDDHDWEDIYGFEGSPKRKQTYSAVLKGLDGDDFDGS